MGHKLLLSGVPIANLTMKRLWMIGASAISAILVPGGTMLGLIAHYGVNVPFWDEWSLISFFQNAHDHALTLRDFLVQNNEHRVVFPKLIFLTLYQFGLWSPRVAMFFSLLLVVLTGAGLQWLLWQTLRDKASATVIGVSFFLTGLLLFSPCQFENWLWGYQLSCFLINLSLIAGVVVICLELPHGIQLLLAATCAIVATFSGGNGMLLWPLLWSVNFLGRRDKTSPAFLIWSGAWLLLAVSATGLYFYDYRKPTGHPPLAASHKFFDYPNYLLTFLGSPLGRRADTVSRTSAVVVGALLVAILALSVIALRRRRNYDMLRARAAPWIAIAGFAVLSACMACIARIGFGLTQALESRYTTFSLLLPISLTPLIILFGSVFAARRRFHLGLIYLGFFTIILALFIMTLPFGIEMMRKVFQTRARGHAALTFLTSIPEKQVLETTVHPSLVYLNIFAPRADALHLLHPPLIGPDALKQLLNSTPVENRHCGTLDKIETSHDDTYRISGRTAKSHSKGSADCIVLFYTGRQTQHIALALGFPVAGHSEWNATVLRTTIHDTGAHEIEAWAFDISRTHLCRLDGRLSFP